MTGSCLCGSVAWQIDGPLDLMHHCHCQRCRKSHGTAYATAAAAGVADFRWTRGTDLIRKFASSPSFARLFCVHCGSALPGEPVGEQVFVPVGSLDADPGVRAVAHIFVGSKAPWHEIADSLPRFEAFPPGFDAPALDPLAVPQGSAGAAVGSCLCGAAAYEIEPQPLRIRSCHCSRCRKARSAAHASNTFVPIDGFRWLRGEDRLASYKVPEALRFTQVFCSTCGAKMPKRTPELGTMVVPAGSLDAAPDAAEHEHIFVGSNPPWLEIADALPQYAEYPPA